MRLRVYNFVLDVGLEPVHDGQRHDQRGHAQRHARHAYKSGDHGEEALPLGEQITSGNKEFCGH
jgi:hypothetical protein